MSDLPIPELPIPTLNFAPPEVEVIDREDGSKILRSPRALGRYPEDLAKLLRRQADAIGDRVFLAERSPAGRWNRLNYAEVAARSGAVAQALLEQARIVVGRRQHFDGEALRMTAEHVERAHADTARAAQDGDAHYAAVPSSSWPSRNIGPAADRLSRRSSTPPCPGSSEPLSLSPA